MHQYFTRNLLGNLATEGILVITCTSNYPCSPFGKIKEFLQKIQRKKQKDWTLFVLPTSNLMKMGRQHPQILWVFLAKRKSCFHQEVLGVRKKVAQLKPACQFLLIPDTVFLITADR